MRPLFARPSMLGAILALLVGGGAYSYMGSGGGGETGPRVSVVVAAEDIVGRSKIAAPQLLVKDFPAEAVHPLAVRTPDQAVGKFTLVPLRAGEPLIAADLSATPGNGDLASLMKEGMRAVSIAVSDAGAAGGFIAPGDHVDLVGIFSEQATATFIASDIEVLAVSTTLIGNTPPPKQPGNPTAVSTTLTLAVTPEMAPRIIVGETLGMIRVSLRRAGDTTPAPNVQVKLDQLLQPLAVGAPPVAAPPATTPAR